MDRSLPHARGGVSCISSDGPTRTPSSPRPWGCFWRGRLWGVFSTVFPTPVGVFLRQVRHGRTVHSLPHARGGVSLQVKVSILLKLSSPRPWGCFYLGAEGHRRHRVFPTPVGVFLRTYCRRTARRCLPHARGGVSKFTKALGWPMRSSPRPWGCFRSAWWAFGRQRRLRRSSPRPWGCFREIVHVITEAGVFPTPVGVCHVGRNVQKTDKSVSVSVLRDT